MQGVFIYIIGRGKGLFIYSIVRVIYGIFLYIIEWGIGGLFVYIIVSGM
jgi:hypothetical protein